MKIFVYLCLLSMFLVVGFSACNRQKVDIRTKELDESFVHTVEYDSCEYIVVGQGNFKWGSHKGNCKNPIHNKKWCN